MAASPFGHANYAINFHATPAWVVNPPTRGSYREKHSIVAEYFPICGRTPCLNLAGFVARIEKNRIGLFHGRIPVPTDAWVKIGAATSPVFSKDGRTLFHLRGAGLPQV